MMTFKHYSLHNNINVKQSQIEASGVLKPAGIKANLQCLRKYIVADNYFKNLLK